MIPEWCGDGPLVEELDVHPGGTYRFRTAHGVEEGATGGFARVDARLQRPMSRPGGGASQ